MKSDHKITMEYLIGKVKGEYWEIELVSNVRESNEEPIYSLWFKDFRDGYAAKYSINEDAFIQLHQLIAEGVWLIKTFRVIN